MSSQRSRAIERHEPNVGMENMRLDMSLDVNRAMDGLPEIIKAIDECDTSTKVLIGGTIGGAFWLVARIAKLLILHR